MVFAGMVSNRLVPSLHVRPGGTIHGHRGPTSEGSQPIIGGNPGTARTREGATGSLTVGVPGPPRHRAQSRGTDGGEWGVSGEGRGEVGEGG
jgi:hypothetical protein